MSSKRKSRSPKRGSPRTALAKKPREGTLRVMRTWENFEESVGGREKLIDSLQHCPDAEGQRLLQHLEDPRAKRQSLRTLCADARVSFPQLYSIFKDAVRAKAHAEVLLVQAEYLPAIMEDSCRDALSQTDTCPTCGGEVKGRGSIDNRRLVFESAGLTGRRAPLVTIEQPGPLEGLMPGVGFISRSGGNTRSGGHGGRRPLVLKGRRVCPKTKMLRR